jgi:hypothetical protein
MSEGGKPTYHLWIDGKSREYYKSDGKWRDKNGIDRNYLFDGQDNYLGLRNGKVPSLEDSPEAGASSQAGITRIGQVFLPGPNRAWTGTSLREAT